MGNMGQINFPAGFLWGAATSAHQVEGNNLNSDWWEYEQTGRIKVPSGAACSQYELYAQDFDLAAQLKHNSHRLSVEWSRVEPQEGTIQESEIAHYKNVIRALRERNIEPIVTLHHFTNPAWVAREGGWLNKKTIRHFLQFAEKITAALAQDVRYWITINEPLVYTYHSYILGVWPPQERSVFKAFAAENNLARAHIATYRLINEIYARNKLPKPSISIAQNMQGFTTCTPNLRNKLAVFLRNKYYNFNIIDKLIRHKALDFIGINYYGRSLIEVSNWLPQNIALETCKKNHLPVKKNSLGWDIYPQGLYELLIKSKRYRLPIMITENGICTQDDALRWEYISEHLKVIHKAIQEGVDVKGYLYWSLIDNFEWDKGFTPRFGIIEVDYKSYKRTIRDSARRLASVYERGVL